MSSRRLFVALPVPPLPEEAERLLQEILEAHPGARRTRDEARHITLAFLGDVPEERLRAVREAVKEAAKGISPIACAFERIEGFPGRAARIVALVGKTPKRLSSLAQELAERLRAAGAQADPKPLRMHLTLARLREPQTIATRPIPEMRFHAEEIRLYESELLPAGARYTILETRALSATLGEGGE